MGSISIVNTKPGRHNSNGLLDFKTFRREHVLVVR